MSSDTLQVSGYLATTKNGQRFNLENFPGNSKEAKEKSGSY